MPRRVVQTEMAGPVPGVGGPRGAHTHNPGGLPVVILDACTALGTVPTRTMTMRVNAAPRMDLGLSRTRRANSRTSRY